MYLHVGENQVEQEEDMAVVEAVVLAVEDLAPKASSSSATPEPKRRYIL